MEGLQSLNSVNKGEGAPEKITSAAIRFNGETYIGLNHGLAILHLEKVHPLWKKMGASPVEEGFLTSFGRFVDREEAAEIADHAGQTDKENVDSRINPKEMDSSELTRKTIH